MLRWRTTSTSHAQEGRGRLERVAVREAAQHPDLSGTNLSGTNLTGANLTEANLSGANLSGANFSGAILPFYSSIGLLKAWGDFMANDEHVALLKHGVERLERVA